MGRHVVLSIYNKTSKEVFMSSFGVVYIIHNSVYYRYFILYEDNHIYVGPYRYFRSDEDGVRSCCIKNGRFYIQGQKWSSDDYVIKSMDKYPPFKFTHLLCNVDGDYIPVMIRNRTIFKCQREIIEDYPLYVITNKGHLVMGNYRNTAKVKHYILLPLQ